MTVEKNELPPLKFRFKGKIARLLGRESVSNPIVALSELVKNSYDADASRVTVRFENTRTKNATIRVIDDGIGMSYEDFTNRWMVVGTDFKEKSRISPSGRRMIGEKGIGRFSVERLADQVQIISSVKGEKNKLHVIIDWNQYESEESYFDNVENRAFLEPKSDVNCQGLEIILKGLRDTWDQPLLLDLRRQMSMLVPPETLGNKDFSINIQTPDYPLITGKIENIIFTEAFYIMTAFLSESGKVRCLITDRKGRARPETIKLDSAKCGPVKFTLYFYPRGFSKDERAQYKVLTLAQVKDILENFHGIRIYRDGFRVKPYGDPTNDWLNLNMRRLQLARYLFPDNSQVIGIVQISRDKNSGLIDTTTREGLIKNDAFKDLVTFLNRSIDLLAKRRRDDRKNEKPPKTVIGSQVDRIITEIQSTPIPTKKKEFAIKELEKVEETALNMIMVYRNLASVGITLMAVGHEIVNPISTIMIDAEALHKNIKRGNYTSEQFDAAVTNIHDNITRVWEFVNFIVAYNRKKRRKKSKSNMGEIIREVLSGYEAILRKRKIDVELQIGANIDNLFLYRGDFESILINFITNSLEALRTKGNLIKISVYSDSENVFIKFSDNGRGIPLENREIIFEPFYSTKEDGTGLGLKIIKETVEEYGGLIKVIDSELDYGATFEVKIPKTSLMEDGRK